MILNCPYWFFMLLPWVFLLAALFWGAPFLSWLGELGTLLTSKPFPARCARQASRLGLWAQIFVWILIGAGVLGSMQFTPLWSKDLVQANSMIVGLGLLVVVLGFVLLIIYDLSWKKAREYKVLHFLLGTLSNLCFKYGYWTLVVLALIATRGLSITSPNFIPAFNSVLWPLACLWLPLSLMLAASLAWGYLIIRRNKDDWGRDYYRYAPKFFAKIHLGAGFLTLMVLAWIFFSLQGVFNLFLPQIWYAVVASVLLLVCSALCSALVLYTQNPMRLKGLMVLDIGLSYLHLGLLIVALVETLNRYVPGWQVSTFMPTIVEWIHF